MALSSGWLALLLLGGDDADRHAIEYRIQVVEMNDLDWRGTFHERLTPIARRAAGSVWTADRGVADELVESAGRVIAKPTLQAQVGQPATFQFDSRRNYVANIQRVADGPVDQAKSLGWKPELESLSETFRATLDGRPLDQGMLTRVTIEDTHFIALHTATIRETVPPRQPEGKPTASVTYQYQVPEVATRQVEGEWLVPSRGVLIVGLGTHTSSDRGGEAVVRERLALIQATASPSSPVNSLSAFRDAPPSRPRWIDLMPTAPHLDDRVIRAAIVPVPGPVFPSPAMADPVALPMPAVPSRVLPPAFDAEGRPVTLPPLPDPDVDPADFEESSEPRPSPQFRPIPGRPEASEPEASNLDPIDSMETDRLHFPIVKLVLAPSPSSGLLIEGSSAEPLRLRVPMLGGLCGLQIGAVRERYRDVFVSFPD